MRELYEAENKGKAEPSGSQDMIGLVYPGINRLDYDFKIARRRFSRRTSNPATNAKVARWLESVLAFDCRSSRGRDGYSPLGVKNLEPKWVARLGQSGKDCFDAIVEHGRRRRLARRSTRT